VTLPDTLQNTTLILVT